MWSPTFWNISSVNRQCFKWWILKNGWLESKTLPANHFRFRPHLSRCECTNNLELFRSGSVSVLFNKNNKLFSEKNANSFRKSYIHVSTLTSSINHINNWLSSQLQLLAVIPDEANTNPIMCAPSISKPFTICSPQIYKLDSRSKHLVYLKFSISIFTIFNSYMLYYVGGEFVSQWSNWWMSIEKWTRGNTKGTVFSFLLEDLNNFNFCDRIQQRLFNIF